MFQFEPVQLPSLSLRMMNCCWVPELTWPVTTESLMKPPDDQLLVVLPEELSSSTRLPSICTRRIGSACDTAHSVLPDDGSRVMFSTPRQKFVVAFPPFQAALAIDPAAGDHRLGRVLPEADDLGVEADRDADVVGARLEHQLIALGAELVRLLRVVDRVDVALDRAWSTSRC